MSYYLSLHRLNDNRDLEPAMYISKLWGRREANEFKRICGLHSNMAGFADWSVMPIRTDWQHLPSDLFLPTLVNSVIKTNGVVNIHLVLIAFIWDMMTLPIRMITLPFRVIRNCSVGPHKSQLLKSLKHRMKENGCPFGETHLHGELVVRIYKEEHEKQGWFFSKNDNVVQTGDSYYLHMARRQTPYVPKHISNDKRVLTLGHCEKEKAQAPLLESHNLFRISS